MKKIFTALMLTLVTSVTFAMSTPKQIEDELAAHNYSSAQTKIAEVISAHPDSARAHLLNSVAVLHTTGDKQLAANELKLAKQLDKKGDVVSSPLFGRATAEIDNYVVAPRNVAKAPVAAPHNYSQQDDYTLLYVILGVGGIALLAYIAFGRDKKPSVIYIPEPSYPASQAAYVSNSQFLSNTSTSSGRPMSRYFEQPTTYVAPQAHSASVVTQSAGMGIMGTAMGVAGGVVAGELIYDGLTGRRKHNREERYESSSNDNYVPPVQQDYETERSSYNSSSSGSDSWGSSSSDSSSSYSDSSSSSGSDW